MIVLGTEECLVHCAAHKFIDTQSVEHVPQRIRLGLEPKPVVFLHVRADGKRSGLTGANDHTVVVRLGNRPDAWLELSDEEVVPRLEAEIGSFGIVNEIVHLQGL